MSWESWVFPLQYQDFLHLKSNFPHLKLDFPCTKSDLPKSAFYFLWQLSAFFNGFLTFFNGFLLSPTAFWISPTAFQFSSTAFRFPRNPRKSIYGKKYMKDRYSSFIFFATCSPSFVITNKQYLRDYPTVKGDQLFSDTIFLVLVLRTNWCTTICITCPILREIVQFLCKIECNKFVCNKFASNFVKIDQIQFEFSNCIRSICTKTNTNLLHTNSLHSIRIKLDTWYKL